MDMNDIPGSCRKIEKLLAASGWTKEDFYRKAGIHRTTWLRWLAGDHLPSIKKFRRVAAAVPNGKKGRA